MLQEGADCIVVDIAHGDSKLEIEMIRQIHHTFAIILMLLVGRRSLERFRLQGGASVKKEKESS